MENLILYIYLNTLAQCMFTTSNVYLELRFIINFMIFKTYFTTGHILFLLLFLSLSHFFDKIFMCLLWTGTILFIMSSIRKISLRWSITLSLTDHFLIKFENVLCHGGIVCQMVEITKHEIILKDIIIER